jgi:cell division protein ZipA
MDISVRDWMIIIGVLLIVAVLLDGYRRMRSPGRVRVAIKKMPTEAGDEDLPTTRELPNGGARVIGRGETRSKAGSDGAADEPPMVGVTAGPDRSKRMPRPDTATMASGAVGENLDLLESITADRGEVELEEPRSGGIRADADSEVLMLHVVSRDQAGFPGNDILQVLLAYDMRFGELDFFHRHERGAGKGAVQFSVANMRKPGVFNIDAMGDFSTTGLIFFMTLPGPQDMMRAFDLMHETARGVAENLGGELLDETRSVITRQTLDHMRQRIRDLERRLLTRSNRPG